MNKSTTQGSPQADGGLARRSPGESGRSSSTSRFRAWLHESLADISPESSILAVGCDEAFLAPQLLEYAERVTVLDTSAGQIAQLARRFPEVTFLHHHVAKPLPFRAETFDVVCCCELLDRVFDPQVALRELHRVLTPGGRLLGSVSDHGAVKKMLSAIFGRGEERAAATPRIHYFTQRALTKAAREAGFRQLQATTCPPPNGSGSDGAVRRLLLKGRRGPEVRRDVGQVQPAASAAAWSLHQDLVFAGRSRAA